MLLASLLLAARLLTLEEALQNAAQRQPQLREAHAATQGAQARTDAARAPLLPQVGATAGYSYGTRNATGATTDARGNFSDSLTANQLIWDFGQTTGRWRSARAQAESSAQTEENTRQAVLFSVRSAYFTARAGKALAGVAREALDNQQKHLEQIQGFVDVGTRAQIDLAQARTDLANSRVALINAENNYAVARAQLNQAMGVEADLDYDVADTGLPVLEGEDSPSSALLEEAVKARPDVMAQESLVRAAELALSAQRGAYWPTLGAGASLGQGGPALNNLTWNWNAGVTLTWQLFQGGLTNAQVREEEAALAQSAAQLDQARQQVRLELEQALLSVRAAKATLGATHDAVLSAREQLQLAEGRYQSGAGSSIELSDAQLAVNNAAAQAVQADQKLATARAQLLKALGRT